MKTSKLIKKIVALILTLTVALMIPLQSSAANKGKYVSEIYIAYGKDEESAKQILTDKGFTPMEHKYYTDFINFNREGKTAVVMGYKTTNDIRDSITDLAVMNMNGNYSVEDYKTLLKSQKTQIAEFLNEFMATIKEYRANLKAGKLKATYVHDLLNNYTDDDTGMKMGDLLNSETLQDKVGVEESVEAENPDNLPNLVTILMQGNAMVVKSIEVLLSMAADSADNTWIDRFAELDYDTLLDKIEEERPELNTESKRIQYLNNLYEEVGLVLGEDTYRLRLELEDYEGSGLHIDTATKEDIKNAFGDTTKDPEALDRYNKWLTIGAIYEGLKNYEGGRYKAGELLDFFLQGHEADDEEVFLPMAAALSDGQRYGLPFVSFNQLLTYAFTNDEGWKNFADKAKFDFDGMAKISVYQNIDRDLYKDDGSVALTGAAQRANNTADGTTGSYGEKMDTLAAITSFSWMAALASTVVMLGSVAYAYGKASTVAYMSVAEEWDDEVLRALFSDDEYMKYMSNADNFYGIKADLHNIQMNSAHFAVKLAKLIGVITLAITVVSAVLTIIEMSRDKNYEQLPIPKYLVDNYTDADGGSYALNYKAVECNREEFFGKDYTVQKGNCADLLADEGKQWLVLYASKNSKAGRPITPDFLLSDYTDTSEHSDGLHMIGEKGLINTIDGAFMNYSTLSQTWQNITGDNKSYLHYKRSDDVKTYDESAGNMTATSMSGGMIAIWGFGGLALGAVLGIVGTILVKRKKKTEE